MSDSKEDVEYNESLYDKICAYLRQKNIIRDTEGEFELANTGGKSFIDKWPYQIAVPTEAELRVIDHMPLRNERKLKNKITQIREWRLARLTTAEINSIRLVDSAGMLLFNEDTGKLFYSDGTKWNIL
jgi:hypothetical protein